jgi:hypothetical protein
MLTAGMGGWRPTILSIAEFSMVPQLMLSRHVARSATPSSLCDPRVPPVSHGVRFLRPYRNQTCSDVFLW